MCKQFIHKSSVVKIDYFKFLLSTGKTASSKYMYHLLCNIKNLCILPESAFMCLYDKIKVKVQLFLCTPQRHMRVWRYSSTHS